MYPQIFAALFVLALIGQHLATAAPLSDKKQHHGHNAGRYLAVDGPTKENDKQHHRPGRHNAASSVQEIDNMLRELDMDTTVLIADKDKVTEIYPEQRELPLETMQQLEAGEQLPVLRRSRRSNRRRSRRSAALLLHATLRICDLRPITCSRIMLQRDNVRVSIRLVDE